MTQTDDTHPANGDLTRRRLIRLILALTIVVASLMAIFAIRKPGIIEGVVIYEQPGRGHNDSLEIEDGDLPLVGGVHSSEWQSCGIYSEPIDHARAIHSLEHGAVWITYNPELETNQLTELETLVNDQAFLLLSPFPGQRSPIALTAWGAQLEVENSDDERIPAFISRYRLGPTTPERGAAC